MAVQRRKHRSQPLTTRALLNKRTQAQISTNTRKTKQTAHVKHALLPSAAARPQQAMAQHVACPRTIYLYKDRIKGLLGIVRATCHVLEGGRIGKARALLRVILQNSEGSLQAQCRRRSLVRTALRTMGRG